MPSDELSQFSSPQSSEPPAETHSATAGIGGATSGLGSSRSTPPSGLVQQEAELKRSIAELQATYSRMLQDQAQQMQSELGRLVRQSLMDLEKRKQSLQLEVEQLERRQERIQAEMRTSFAGVSQDLAIRVKGFKDYLVGSLQDLATAAEQLELIPPQPESPPSRESNADNRAAKPPSRDDLTNPGFAVQRFQEQTERIRSLLDQYRMRPDYYGPIWQLRRTFEPIHADKVSNWFFTQGGRGALKSMGSRLQNVLVASAAISILHTIYGDRLRVLVLANTPERLGDWRRGLQDCLGVSRADFGADRGIVLFEAPEPLVQRADRCLDMNLMPLVIVDESEDKISLSLLQFPLWLAFAADPLNPTPEFDYY